MRASGHSAQCFALCVRSGTDAGRGTILRVLARIDAKQLKKVFIDYARETFGKKLAENEVLAIDGKTIRHSEYAPADENKTPHKAVHEVSAWSHSLGVCFGQVKTEAKSNR